MEGATRPQIDGEEINDLDHMSMHIYYCAHEMVMAANPKWRDRSKQIGYNPKLSNGILRGIEVQLRLTVSEEELSRVASSSNEDIGQSFVAAFHNSAGNDETEPMSIELPQSIIASLVSTALTIFACYDMFEEKQGKHKPLYMQLGKLSGEDKKEILLNMSMN